MSRFTVDKDVPIPESRQGRRTSVYPFEDMGVGDSFLVSQRDVEKVRSALSQRKKRKAEQYITRTTEGGLRVWRTA